MEDAGRSNPGTERAAASRDRAVDRASYSVRGRHVLRHSSVENQRLVSRTVATIQSREADKTSRAGRSGSRNASKGSQHEVAREDDERAAESEVGGSRRP